MISSKPYLIRALYDWIVDNGLTPYVLVRADAPDTLVPQEYVKAGQIVLNIRAEAVQGLLLGNEAIEFKARFSGTPRQVYVPIAAVMSIYASENGQGMSFPEETTTTETETAPNPPKRGKPDLKIVE